MKLREALADALVAEDVQLLFALMGNANLELICDVAERCRVPLVFGRHEQGVVGMADGYARFSGQPGVMAAIPGSCSKAATAEYPGRSTPDCGGSRPARTGSLAAAGCAYTQSAPGRENPTSLLSPCRQLGCG